MTPIRRGVAQRLGLRRPAPAAWPAIVRRTSSRPVELLTVADLRMIDEFCQRARRGVPKPPL